MNGYFYHEMEATNKGFSTVEEQRHRYSKEERIFINSANEQTWLVNKRGQWTTTTNEQPRPMNKQSTFNIGKIEVYCFVRNL